MKKKKLLILSKSQFGYHTDTFKYCEYGREKFDITYVGWDYSRDQICMEGIIVKYINRNGSLVRRNIRLLSYFNNEIKKGFDLVFIDYTRGVSIIKFLNRNTRFIFDIRTLSVQNSWFKRVIYNLGLKIESLYFKNITVVSDGVAKQLRLNKYHILPLGATPLSFQKKVKRGFNLLYVGTLQGRDILKCVKGFKEYLRRTNDLDAKFTIVGDSPDGELDEIKKYIVNNNISSQVVCTGRIPHSQLKQYYEEASVGVSFIPIKSYYNFQPPTKTFEYLLSGLPVIGTNTYENIKVLKNQKISVLINDTEEDFENALSELKKDILKVNPDEIIKSARMYTWECIIKDNALPFFLNICSESF
jgi:glycosyltransferase involved in cell wall biosynthesis